MERLTGTRYSYTKTRVAFLVPFVFLLPALAVALLIFALNTRALLSEGIFTTLSLGMKLLVVFLLLLGFYFARDLWRIFQRTVSEEIWITDRDIVWVGRGRKVLLRAPHVDVLGVAKIGTDPENTWIYEIETKQGNIRFTRTLEHADELIGRIETFVNRGRQPGVESKLQP
jgi:Zn-dependent protease with chaperone function